MTTGMNTVIFPVTDLDAAKAVFTSERWSPRARRWCSRAAGRDARDDAGMTTWGDMAAGAPELAAFGTARLTAAPAYLATVRASGVPRVHPVTPIVTGEGLFLFMEPTSPKGRDLREGRGYALHAMVPDNHGTGGEFAVSGHGRFVDDAAVRAKVTAAAAYDPADRYVLFELLVETARANGYGDVELPTPRRWP
jgi:hypothetical protein